MKGKLMYDVACLLAITANDAVVKSIMPGEDHLTQVRGSLILAALSYEVRIGTQRKDILNIIGKLYDILQQAPTN